MTALECKKHRLSQNQDGGWRLTLNIHPHDDMPDWLLKAAPGQRMGVALVPIADEHNQERPARSDEISTSEIHPAPDAIPRGGKPDGAGPAPLPKVKRKWEDMAIVTRAGMMCSDERAWPVFDRFHDKAPILCEREAEIFLRAYCGVMSRTQIDDNPDARHNFLGIETEYLRATRP